MRQNSEDNAAATAPADCKIKPRCNIWYDQIIGANALSAPAFCDIAKGENSPARQPTGHRRVNPEGEGNMDVKALNRMAAALLNRHAGRLAKWRLTNTVKLVKDLEVDFAANGPRSHAQMVAITESTMLAMDRVNTWIDAMIPWSDLDAKLKLNRAAK